MDMYNHQVCDQPHRTVFQHQTPPPVERVGWRDIPNLLICAMQIMALGAAFGAIPGLLSMAMGKGWEGLFLCVSLMGSGTLIMMAVASGEEYVRALWQERCSARFPLKLAERASAQVFVHWMQHSNQEFWQQAPLRGDVRWEVEPEGLVLRSLSAETEPSKYGEFEDYTPEEPLPPHLQRMTWEALGGAPAAQPTRLERLG